ncbi:Ig domain-containing protein [Leptospira limi]|uniref:Ig domain-containing protein n=1 Tax=Leptospira limi TaxID=2950023 RepID=A0ABT3LWE0_9LEPT|nr:Ig domain-containing protein [Leptospira limi]MCW7462040.1 Ig domain-containing protein [Leptospira limi]
MGKKIYNNRYAKIIVMISFVFVLLNCSDNSNTNFSSWMEGILLVVKVPQVETPNEPDKPTLENEFEIHSITPDVLLENTNFVITGKNLHLLSPNELWGEGGEKYVSFTNTSDDEIKAQVKRCSKPILEVLFVIPSKGKENRFLPCLGSFYYSFRSYFLETNQEIVNFEPRELNPSLQGLVNLGEIVFGIEPELPSGISFDTKTGIVTGIPTSSTNQLFQPFQVTASLKTNPKLKIHSDFQLIVLTSEEKNNRTCREISATSTCKGPSPHVCSNSDKCFMSKLACVSDTECGL